MKGRIGKYEVVRRVGCGGMAEVFQARLCGPGEFQKDVAIKQILPHLGDDPEFVQMFAREASIAARLDHANIVRVYDHQWQQGRPFMAMEWVDGVNLAVVLARLRARGQGMSVAQAVFVAHEVCQALSFAHGDGRSGESAIVHRDVSPHNILLSRAGEVKLSDFGIARLLAAEGFTRPGVLKGKLGYMSPEQARGLGLDGRSDLFSLGCVLWEMLAGRPLFPPGHPLAHLEPPGRAPIPLPSADRGNVPPGLDRLVIALLEPEPAARPTSAREVARALEALLGAVPTVDRAVLLADLLASLERPGQRKTGVLLQQDPTPPGITPAGSPQGSRPTPRSPGGGSTPAAPGLVALAAAGLIALAAMGLIALAASAWGGWTAEERPVSPEGRTADLSVPSAPSVAATPQRPLPLERPVDAKQSHINGLRRAGRSPSPSPSPSSLPRPRTPVGIGWLDLNALPWAEVYLDGRRLGETPLQRIELPAGRRWLVLVNEELGLRQEIQVEVRADQLTREVVSLQTVPPD